MKKSRRLTKSYREKIVRLRRKHHHPLLHRIHKQHRISYKTLSYMKEYGPRSHVYHVIIKESIKILVLASLLSSIGGFGLQNIQGKLIALLPLLILLPALNDMIGDYGAIVSSKFTNMLYLRKIKGSPWKSKNVHSLFFTVLPIAIISSLYMVALSSGLALLSGFGIDLALLIKILWIALISTLILVTTIFLLSVLVGVYIFKKSEDPNNFLIPIATSVGDLGSMAIFTFLITLFF